MKKTLKPGHVVALISLLFSSTAMAVQWKVVSALGDGSAVHGDRVEPLRAGMVLKDELTLRTGENAVVQLRTDDGAILSLTGNSEVVVRASPAVRFVRGQLALWSDDRVWRVETEQVPLRFSGFLRLATCFEGCTEPRGVYGRINGGEAIAEYLGGRSVLRERSFRLAGGGGKPEMLARDPGLLGGPRGLDEAAKAKAVAAEQLRRGLEAYRAGDYATAQSLLSELRLAAGGEPVVSYYLGLIALEQERDADALRHLQQYAKQDPDGARQREVGKLITLLTSSELQRAVAEAVQKEKSADVLPPEPGSIAVQTFAAGASPAFAALAKGIAAMTVSDLAKVPGLKVLEREKMQKISDELRLSESGLVDEATALRAGRLMRAENVVVGTIGVGQ